MCYWLLFFTNEMIKIPGVRVRIPKIPIRPGLSPNIKKPSNVPIAGTPASMAAVELGPMFRTAIASNSNPRRFGTSP